MTDEVAGATLVHASLNDPGDFYHVLKLRHAKKHFLHQLSHLCCNGHTHHPIIFEKGETWIESCKPPDGFISLNPRSKYLVIAMMSAFIVGVLQLRRQVENETFSIPEAEG